MIGQPREQVWVLVGNVDAWPTWVSDISDVHVDGELRRGASVSYRYGGRDVQVTVSELEVGRVLGIHGSERHYELDESIALDDADGSTRVSITMRFLPTAWWARGLAVVLAPFARLALARPLGNSLRNLKRAAENDRA